MRGSSVIRSVWVGRLPNRLIANLSLNRASYSTTQSRSRLTQRLLHRTSSISHPIRPMSHTKEIIEVPVLSDVLRKMGVPLSPVTKGGGFVFVSGIPGIDLSTGQLFGGDISRQAELSCQCLEACLKAAGSSMDKVMKVTIFAANSGHFKRINEVYAKYFPESPPARTFVAVGSWPLDFDMEIECTALA